MGEQLIDDIAEATGLPKEVVTGELKRLVTAAGLNPADTTLDDLRMVLTGYVQDVLLEAKDRLEQNDEPSTSSTGLPAID